MAKRMKKIIALALSCLMLVGTNLQVFAASSVSGTFSGTAVYGSISTNTTSATAVTSYARSGATIGVSALVYYWWDTSYYYSTATTYSSAGGTSATATKKYGGADVLGGQGQHNVTVNGVEWGIRITQVGTCKSNSIYVK